MYLRLRSTAISCPPTKYLASPYVGVAERLFDSTVETVFVIQKSFSDDVALCVHDLREFRLGQFEGDRKSTRLNSSHGYISYAVFCLKKKNHKHERPYR